MRAVLWTARNDKRKNMKTIKNFRDCGGYITTDGRQMRTGRVYRSGTLDDARPNDLRTLQTFGLKTIVDLRAPREKKKELPAIDSARRIDLPIELENRAREKLQPLMTKRGAESEVISAEMIDYVQYLLRQRIKIVGPEDLQLKTIRIIE